MPLYEVVLQQTYQNQQCINRFNYFMAGTPASVSGSFALASALGAIYDELAVPPAYPPGRFIRLLAACQHSTIVFDFLGVRNLYSVTDFYESPFVQPVIGLVSGESASPALAYGMRTNRVRTDVRRATKRFSGVSEGQMTNGGLVLNTFISGQLQPLAANMSANLTYDDEGNTLTFSPVVCGKEKYLPDPAHPEKPAYRYYATEAEQMSHTAQGILWDVYPQIRTQTSRQYGRGR